MLAQKEPLNHSVRREKPHIEALNKTTVRSSTRKARLQAGTESIGVKKVQPEPPIQASCAPQAQGLPPSYSVRRDHTQGQHPVVDIASHEHRTSDFTSTMEQEKLEHLNQSVNVEHTQAEYQSKTTGWNPNMKRSSKSTSGKQQRKKGLASSPNEGLHLRRSKRLTKQTEHAINDQPVQRPAASPNECNSDPPDIDGIIANLCPSPLPRHQMPQASSRGCTWWPSPVRI